MSEISIPANGSWSPSWGPAPRLATPRTPERPTYGPAIARIAELLGTPLFPGQRYAYDVALEVQSEEAGDPDPGELAYGDILDTEPRRSGKTFKVGPLVAHVCGSGAGRQAWMTAQNREKANRRWEVVKNQLHGQGSPLRSQLRVRDGKGDQRITWTGNASTFLPFSPNDDAMHGEDPDLVIVDELWTFDLDQKSLIEQGYEPAWAVKPGQVWKLSAAGTEESGWLNLERARSEKVVAAQLEAVGARLGSAVFDWSVPDEVGGVAVDELPDEELLEVVLACHPRRDNGLRREFLVVQLGKSGRADFLRAYGNRTKRAAVKLIIDAAALARAQTPDPIPPRARVGVGFAVDADSREVAVSAAWRNPRTGVALLEVVKVQDGTAGAAELIRDFVVRNEPGAVGVNNVGPARDLADRVERLGVELLRLPAGDYAAGWDRLHEEITAPAPRVRYREPEFVGSVKAAALRRLPRGSRVPAARGEEPITVLEAHIAALWAVDHMPPAVPRFKIA